MKILIAIAISILLLTAGCATDPETAKAIAKANQAIASKPTLSIECPATGCQFSKLSYTDPRDKQGMAMPTNGWDAVKSLGNNAERLGTSVLPVAAAAYIAREGMKNAGHNETNTASGAGSSTGGTGSYSQIGPDSANQANTSAITFGDQGVNGGGSVSAPTTDDHSGSNNPVSTNCGTITTGPC